MRLISGSEGWWLLSDQYRVWLPREAAKFFSTSDGVGLGLRGTLNPGIMEALKSRGVDVSGESTRRSFALTILTTTGCNLACPYCFQNAVGESGGTARIKRTTLSSATVEDVVKFCVSRCRKIGATNTDVVLFGGEPLINYKACIYLMSLLGGKNLLGHVQLVSNGVLLTEERYGVLVDRGLTGVQITLDGPQDIHDRTRATIAGRGTFGKILENLRGCINGARGAAASWNIRLNVTKESQGRMGELISLLADSLDVRRRRITLTLGLIDDNGIGFTDVVGADAIYSSWLVDTYMFAIKHGFRYPLMGGISECIYCSQVGGLGGAVVDPVGQLYSCWESAGKNGHVIGDVLSGLLPDDELSILWSRCCDHSQNQLHGGSATIFSDKIDAFLLDYERSVRRANA